MNTPNEIKIAKPMLNSFVITSLLVKSTKIKVGAAITILDGKLLDLSFVN